jgi:hypothetical protein
MLEAATNTYGDHHNRCGTMIAQVTEPSGNLCAW